MSGWTVIGNHFRNVTQVQNAYSSRDVRTDCELFKFTRDVRTDCELFTRD